MKIPLRPSILKVRREGTKFIILHHTAELYPQPGAKIDNRTYQLPEIFKGALEQKTDINYHYIIERVGEDYIPIICRPLPFLCEWDDIKPEINKRSIHIAILGNCDMKIPPKRLYEVLAYRLINPLLKVYTLAPNRVKLHSQVSSNEELSCPGDFFDLTVVKSMIRRFVIK